MPQSLEGQLVVAISSRALFDFEEENRVFETQGDEAYTQLQLERKDIAATPGVAYPLVRKLLRFNDHGHKRVEVVILSRNDPVSGLRVFNSAKQHGLMLERGVFTRGREPYPYLDPLRASLFLSAQEDDVRAAIHAGFPAARVYPTAREADRSHADEIRIAFDGDAVLFSDQAEMIYKQGGLMAFQAHEIARSADPLPPGPFKPLLEALHRLQSAAPAGPLRIRTALVTARSAPAHERAIRTLMQWNIVVDEAMFLGGLDKAPFLEQFAPDFFFDDQTGYCDTAAEKAPTGHVPSGIANRPAR